MKKINFTSALLIVLLAFTACKKDKTDKVSRAQNAKQFTETFGPQKQTLSFNTSELPKTLNLSGGTKITIQPNSFTINGSPATGAVTIEAFEMLKRSDILLSGTNTNHISGALLKSDGFIYINAKVNGVDVDKALAAPVRIAIPTARDGFTML